MADSLPDLADEVVLPIPDVVLEALASRVAEHVVDRLREELKAGAPGGWMRTREAADYLGWSRGALYSRVQTRTVPYYKVDGILLFKRDELDEWLGGYRQAPGDADVGPRVWQQPDAPMGSGPTTAAKRDEQRPGRERAKPKRERPLPPPIGGDEAQKERWARDLEISRAELDQMSPKDFKRAWNERNRRLEEAGVFDHLDDLSDQLGWDRVTEMTPSQLIEAVSSMSGESSGS